MNGSVLVCGSRRGMVRLEAAVRIVLALLVILKCGVLGSEPRIWSRPDPVLPLLPMAGPVVLAIAMETFVFLLLGEKEVSCAWKACSLYCMAGVVGAYRASGMLLNGINFAGCKCFGVLGDWLSGAPSTALAVAVLFLFAFAARHYARVSADIGLRQAS
jgi:hypothetical protein